MIKLKICGVMSVAEAQLLIDCGVDFVGLNFIPHSARCLALGDAILIMNVLKGKSLKTVALFKDQPIEFVNSYTDQLSVDYVQLCGEESKTYSKIVKVPVMRTLAITATNTSNNLDDIVNSYPAEYFVLDRHIQGKGERVNLDLAKDIISKQPDKVFLAGGLTTDNLASTLARVQPYGIDIAAGVRTDSMLDREKIDACLTIIRKSH